MARVLLLLGVTVFLCALINGKEYAEHAGHHPIKTSHVSDDGTHNNAFDHEAVLGSKKKDLSDLPPGEVEAELLKIIKLMDANGDDFISKQELVSWVVRSFQSLDEEEATEKMDDVDSDMDKVVTWEEHLKNVYDYLPEEIEDFDKDENSEVKSLHDMILLDKEKFSRADANKDGKLDEKEYSAFLHPYNFDHMRDLELKEILLDYDKDKDKTITFQEFLGEGGDVPFDKENRISEEENFKSFDKNRDGVLDTEEITAWAMPSHMEAAEEEADHLLQESDSDSDGKLTKQEILDKQDLWIGSSATEYGKAATHDPSEL